MFHARLQDVYWNITYVLLAKPPYLTSFSLWQILEARALRTVWEKNVGEGVEPLKKAADILLTVSDKTAEVITMLGEFLQKSGRQDEVRKQFYRFLFKLIA